MPNRDLGYSCPRTLDQWSYLSVILDCGNHKYVTSTHENCSIGYTQQNRWGGVPQSHGSRTTRSLGNATPALMCLEGGNSDQWAWRAEPWVKEDYSGGLRFNAVCPVGFWNFCGNCSPFLLSYFSVLEWKCLSYSCSTIVVWAHNLFDFTSSQLESNLPQDKFYLESHPYLI